MRGKILVVTYPGETEVYKSNGVDEWNLHQDEWEEASMEAKRIMVDGIEECRELWPDWLVKEVKELEEQWNAEVMGNA